MLRITSFVLLGMLMGLIIMHSIQGKKFENLYWEKEHLRVELYESSQQLKQLQEQQEKMLPSTVTEIKLNIEAEEQTFVEPELKQNIYELIEEILGEEVQTLPYQLLYNLLEDRVVQSGENKYRLKVKAVIIGEIVEYYLEADKIENN